MLIVLILSFFLSLFPALPLGNRCGALIPQRAEAKETGQSEALNGSQESTGGARISGSGGSGDSNKVGSNESPSKESGKSSASTKSPKSKKKVT